MLSIISCMSPMFMPGADPQNRLQVKFINECAWQHLFIKQLFIKPETKPKVPEGFTVMCMPGVKADPIEDNTHSETFIVLNFDKKMVLIGGGEYAGENEKINFFSNELYFAAKRDFVYALLGKCWQRWKISTFSLASVAREKLRCQRIRTAA